MLYMVLCRTLLFSEMRQGLKLSKELNSVNLLQRVICNGILQCPQVRWSWSYSGELPGVGAVS